MRLPLNIDAGRDPAEYVSGFFTRRNLILVASLVVVLWLFFSSLFTVSEFERGIVTRGGALDRIAQPGFAFKIPVIESVTFWRTDIQSVSPSKGVNTYTIDNQEVDIVFNLFYRVPSDKIPFVWMNAQDYHARLYNIAVDRLKSSMGDVNVQHVAEQRGKIAKRITDVMKHDAAMLGIEVVDFQLTNIEYMKGYKDSVEQAAIARQGIETREREREQSIKVADRVRIEAQGAADAVLMRAKADAEAVRLKGDAEASAIRAQTLALQQNTGLVELRKAEKWNGALPTQMLSSVVPFMQFNPPKGGQ